jgi:hypothetical protein
MASSVVLILGAGCNIAPTLRSVLVIKLLSIKDEVAKTADVTGFPSPESVKSVFDKAKSKLDVPSVVVNNGSSLPRPQAIIECPLSLNGG